jgi:hypothetical protein
MTDPPLPSEDLTSVVLVGSFNPRIFQPSWFVRHELLPPLDEEESQVDLINNDFCAFQTSMYRIEVASTRFAAHGIAPPVVEALRDLVQGTFRILRHTPITKIGINTSVHFQLPTDKAYDRFGHILLPKERLWNPILSEPKTLNVSVKGDRPDGYPGHLLVKVEPSIRMERALYIETNDEFRDDSAQDAHWITDILVEQWGAARARISEIRNHLLGQALENE